MTTSTLALFINTVLSYHVNMYPWKSMINEKRFFKKEIPSIRDCYETFNA